MPNAGSGVGQDAYAGSGLGHSRQLVSRAGASANKRIGHENAQWRCYPVGNIPQSTEPQLVVGKEKLVEQDAGNKHEADAQEGAPHPS